MFLPLLVLYLTAFTNVLATRHAKHHLHRLGRFSKDISSNGDNPEDNEVEPKNPVCQTESCRTIANIIKGNMDEGADPCQDFYQYACGNWDKNNPMPENAMSWSFLEKLQQTVDRQAIELLKADNNDDDWLAVKLGKRFFRACTDEERREKVGLGPMVGSILRIGGWPLIMDKDDWPEDKHTWQAVDDYYAGLTGRNAFYKVRSTYLTNGESKGLEIEPRGLPPGSARLHSETSILTDLLEELESTESEERDSEQEKDSQEAGSKEKIDVDGTEDESKSELTPREEYADLITQVAMTVAEYLDYDVNKETLGENIEEMLKFMEKLHEALNSYVTTLNVRSMYELHNWYNNLEPVKGKAKIDWVHKLSSVLEEASVNVDDFGEIQIRLNEENHFLQLRNLLDQTPSRTIVNYIHWQFISNTMQYTNKQMRMLHERIIDDTAFSRLMPKEGTLEEECASQGDMAFVLSYLFVKKYFPEEVMSKADEMVEYVREEVKNQMQQSEWMDAETKEKVLDKLERMRKQIGAPRWVSNVTSLERYYKGLTFGRSHFDNVMNHQRFQTWVRMRSLTEDHQLNYYDMIMPLMVNAMYAMDSNKIFLTAADFQDPFFATMRPSIINYGIVGVLAGHEINHGFDPHGFRYDPEGNPYKWIAEMITEYGDRVSCFIEQYNKYANSSDYGERTQTENVADTMGLEASLGGYYLSREKDKDKPEERLPGFEKFNNEQLFFLSYANLLCESTTKMSKLRLKFDVHSTGRFRTIGAISNSESFGKAFECPTGSPMNPEKKCNIWN